MLVQLWLRGVPRHERKLLGAEVMSPFFAFLLGCAVGMLILIAND